MNNNPTELVFFPAPGVGHLISTVQLAKLILETNQSISISILLFTLPVHSSKLTAFVESESRNNPYSTRLVFISFPTLTNMPDPSSPDLFRTVIDLYKPLVKEMFDNRVKAGSSKPAGFVLDMFCTTYVDVADELGVPSYLYCTSGASTLNFMFWAQKWAEDQGLQARDLAVKISDPNGSYIVPGFKYPIAAKNIPAVFKDEYWGEILINFTRQFRRMKGILVNSYVELESVAIQSLQNSEDITIPPVYPVGPIMDLKSGGGTKDKEKESIMKWLDSQPESSVVFLCFGSMGSFGEEQVTEIANALDQSGHRFLWALRKPPSSEKSESRSDSGTFLEALPEGFLDRTAKRGKVIGWAPQVDVLAHPAVGGFVSHCGWNSTLESLWHNVPIGTWPMYAEQQLNAFELVKELELAVEIRMDYSRDLKLGKDNFIVKAIEIEEGIKKLMSMDNKKIRGNVKEMSDKARKALQNGGSSYNSLGSFIKDVLNNYS
ncbi:anthocyanidin 3-O-glucosyltransferase 2-like [Silene latifolia]|uniref:anthocyanidin 3-O-glucosyltransferase 2-like n=1 Tax=Silene latifolia TaxID=37657 RepID=UPI003D7725F4